MTRSLLYNTVDMTDEERPMVNGKLLPLGCSMNDWMRLHMAPGFYHWLNAIHGCQTGVYWRLTENVGWCGV